MTINLQKTKFFPYILIILLGIAIYSNNLKGPFTYDDFHTIVNNPYIKQPQSISSLFDLSSVSPTSQTRSIYRPVLMFTFYLNYILGRLNPLGYHLINIFLHIFNGLLVFALVKRLLELRQNLKEKIALFCALLFISHPIQTESVNYIISRSELLAAFFLLLSFYLYIRAVNPLNKGLAEQTNYSFYRGCLFAFCLGIFSKETILVLPLIIFLYECLYLGYKSISDFLYRFKKYYFGFIVIVTGYILLRILLLGHFLGALKEVPLRRPFFVNLLTQAKVVVFYYLRLLFFPLGLTVDHYVPESRSIFEFSVLVSLAVIILLLFFAFRLRKKNKVISFFIFWFFINLIPTSIIPLYVIMNEHRIYLSAISLCFCLPLVLLGSSYLKPKKKLKLCTQLILSLFLLLFILLTLRRNTLWQDPLRLWKATAAAKVSSNRSHVNLGLEYLKKDRYAEAEQEFWRAIGIRNSHFAYAGLGHLYYKQGDSERAIEYFRKSQQINPSLAVTYFMLGKIYEEQEQWAEAIAEYQQAIGLDANLWFTHFYLAVLFDQQQNYTEAEREYKQAIALNPLLSEAHYNLGIIYGKTARPEAITSFKQALRLKPDYAEAHYNLAISYLALLPADIESARKHLDRALALGYQADPDLINRLFSVKNND